MKFPVSLQWRLNKNIDNNKSIEKSLKTLDAIEGDDQIYLAIYIKELS